MTMRVTELTKNKAVRSNLTANSNELQRVMVGMATGKRITKPSDDPVGAAKVQDFRTSLNLSKTLEKNIGADKMWLTNSEAAVQQIGDVLQHVKELALEGGNSASTTEFRQNVATELRTIVRDLVKLANKRDGKLYLFSGTKTFTPPLAINSEVLPADVYLDDDTVKARTPIIPLKQNKPIEGMFANSFNIVLHSDKVDEEGKPVPPVKLQIDLNGSESVMDVISKINDAAAADEEYRLDAYSPTGFKTKVLAEMGKDNRFKLTPADGYAVTLEQNKLSSLENIVVEGTEEVLGLVGIDTGPKNFLGIMGLKETTEEEIEENGVPTSNQYKADPAEFDAHWVGYSNNEYMIKILKVGEFGQAQFIVSDDNGKSWSKPKILQRKIHVFNENGKPNDHFSLQFGAGVNPQFSEGMELFFNGNPYVKYQGNEHPKEVLIDSGIKIALNITAKELFYENPNDPDTVNLFDMLNRLTIALEADDPRSVMKSIGEIDTSMNQVLKGRAKIGALVKELESSEERIIKDYDFKAEELSKIEDMDIAKAAMDLNAAEMRNKTALDAASRLIQPTLVNFLK